MTEPTEIPLHLCYPSEGARAVDPAATPPEGLRFHRLANIFPLIEGDEFGELVASISANGLRDPIVLYEGKILDGRNRYRACRVGHVTPRFVELPAGTDALLFVVDHNLRRRHLTDDQRRMVAARLANLGRGRPGENRTNGPISQHEAAELLSVDDKGVQRAKAVVTKGTHELQQAVDLGQVTVRSAADLAVLPVEEQREIVASADPKVIRAAAKSIRAAEQARRHRERQANAEAIASRNPDLPTGRTFPLVLIDVPRHHTCYSDETGSEKAPENHFPTMSFRELADFAIDRFASPDSILLYWSTAASLLDDIDILAEWGYVSLRPRGPDGKLLRDGNGDPLPRIGAGRYGSHQIWRKRRVGRQTGTGRWFLDQHEILIVARRGDVPGPLPGTQAESVFDADIGDHSAKPGDHVRAWIDRCWPLLAKIEVFARGVPPPGWVFWGNQVEDDLNDEAPDGRPNIAKLATVVKPTPDHTAIDDYAELDIPDFLRRYEPGASP